MASTAQKLCDSSLDESVGVRADGERLSAVVGDREVLCSHWKPNQSGEKFVRGRFL